MKPRHRTLRNRLGIPWAVLAVTIACIVTAGACSGTREPQTISIVIPAGTQDRLDAGEKVEIMPSRLEFHVGDTLHIRNDDDVTQSIGPYLVKAGQDFRLLYGSPGVFEGYCPLSEGERYEIVVKK